MYKYKLYIVFLLLIELNLIASSKYFINNFYFVGENGSALIIFDSIFLIKGTV